MANRVKIVIIADDLTGANDTGATLAKQGFPAVSMPSYKDLDTVAAMQPNAMVLAVNAASRALTRDKAYHRVNDLTRRMRERYPDALLVKRIDSTLRGNVGAEIDAMLDALPPAAKTRAIVVPAAPTAGRVLKDGVLYVNNIPLAQSGAAKDPITPVTSSSAMEILTRQCRKKAVLIPLKEIEKGITALKDFILQQTAQVLVFEAAMPAHIIAIAQAVIRSKLPIVAVDPGEFTLQLTMSDMLAQQARTGMRALAVIGSRSDETRAQLEYTKQKDGMLVFDVEPATLITDFDKELRRATAYFTAQLNAGEHGTLCISVANSALVPGLSEQIAMTLCTMAQCLMQEKAFNIDLCYLCGGDVAQQFVKGVRASGLELLTEVLPMAVYARVIGGEWHGLRLLTKGGMIGGKDAMSVLLDHARLH